MDMIIKFMFPLIISLGAVYLTLLEIAGYFRAKKKGKLTPDIVRRLIRRVFGAILIISVAFMLFYGLSKMKAPTPETWEKHARYWVVVVALVIISVLLAVWDMLDGVKNIEEMVKRSSRENIREIRDKILQYKMQEKQQQK